MASIIEMPELVMEKIIEFSEFKAVLTLRQVYRDFRNFIDDLSVSKLPDSKFEEIEITSKEEGNKQIIMIFKSKDSHQRFKYSKKGNSRSYHGKRTILKKSNIVDVAIRDLQFILKFQKSILEFLSFNLDDFRFQNDSWIHTLPIKLSNMINAFGRRIKTRGLSLSMYNQSEAIPILQFADRETLKTLSLCSLEKGIEMEIDEIVKTEQWKKVEEYECDFHVFNLHVEDICHLSRIRMSIKSITAKDLNTLKKAFVRSSKFENLWFRVKQFHEYEELSNTWGPAFIDVFSCLWYFRMKYSEEKILRIETYREFATRFDVIEIEDVPNGAILQDYEEN